MWRGKCGQRASGSAGERWTLQHKTERGGDEWSAAYDTLGVTRHKASYNVGSHSSAWTMISMLL